MNNRKKNALYSIILFALIVAVWWYRKDNKPAQQETYQYKLITGEAQGTTYTIKLADSVDRDFKPAIDSILTDFDNSLSTWVPTSEISRFNQEDSLAYNSPYFYEVLKVSQRIYEQSEGAFDPTVYPLINAWGFGPEQPEMLDSASVDSVLQFIGFERIQFDKKQVKKTKNAVKLSFNAIAQGYSIDVLFNYLQSQGITDMMIELGGEMRVSGLNPQGQLWSIGIDNPKLDAGGSERSAIIKLDNRSISTSGNYRKFFVHEGVKYGHTLNPKTGYPVQRDIISATVVTKSCMTADAWSTAFMVTGLKKAKELLNKNPDIEAFFIYEEADGSLKTFATPGLKDYLLQ